MYRKIGKYLVLALGLQIGGAGAHEMTPAYPEFRPSHVAGLQVTTLRMFNARKDVEWYELGVFDGDRNPVPFVSSYNIVKVPHLETVSIDVYVRNKDLGRTTYICSRSKLRTEKETYALVSSVICSKVK